MSIEATQEIRDALSQAPSSDIYAIEAAAGLGRMTVVRGLQRPDWYPRLPTLRPLLRVVRHYHATGEVVSADKLAPEGSTA